MFDVKLWKKIYDKYDGRYDDAVTEILILMKENTSLKAKLTKCEKNLQKQIPERKLEFKDYWKKGDY